MESRMNDARCYGVMGTASRGPIYCGNKAKSVDRNGRPVCGRHTNQEGIEWFGERGRYPHGVGGSWRWDRPDAASERR